jgi:hypothetical protein
MAMIMKCPRPDIGVGFIKMDVNVLIGNLMCKIMLVFYIGEMKASYWGHVDVFQKLIVS